MSLADARRKAARMRGEGGAMDERRKKEIDDRIAVVREAKLRALREGRCAPSAYDLTLALGDSDGAAKAELERATRMAYERKQKPPVG